MLTTRSQCLSLLLMALLFSARPSNGAEPKAILPRPTPQQYGWHEQERIAFLCLDPCTWQGNEYDNHSTPLDQIKLPKLNTDQWCEAAVSWGAKEILFVAKHSGGFCWWQTDTNDYNVKKIAWKDGKGDLLVELAKSCRKYGLNLGIYISPVDAAFGVGGGGRANDPAKQEAYNKAFRQQWREALESASKYANIVEVWFDGSCMIELGDILKQYAPGAVVFQGPYASIRWVGNEGGNLEYAKSWSTLAAKDAKTGTATAAQSDPNGDAWAALEIDTTLYAHYWFWAAKNEAHRKSLDELMRVYYESAGQGAVLLLNSTPNTDGLIPDADVKRYQEFGAEIERRFGRPLAKTSGRGETLELDLGKPTLINHAVIMENYQHGERIRRYTIEGFDGKQWKRLCEGSHVGRKRINYFDDIAVSKVRLRVMESAAEPQIRGLEVFHVTNLRLAQGRPLRSEWAQCGSWNAAEFKDGKAALDLNLTPYITEAGQWEVAFKPTGERKVSLHGEVLVQEGVDSLPGMLSRVQDRSNTLHVNRTGVVTKESDIRLRITLETDGGEGIILIRRVAH